MNISIKKSKSLGVALLMVLTTITILSFVLGDFLFRIQSSKLRVYNIQDGAQARLNAEAGLVFARAKLKIYQEAYNILQTSKNVQGVFSLSSLESLITSPFVFPLPSMPELSLEQRNAIEEFSKNSLIRGNLSVNLRPITNFLNINAMREVLPQNTQDLQNTQNSFSEDGEDESISKQMEAQILNALTVAFIDKRDSDENFAALYSDINLSILVKEIKYFVSSKGAYDDPELPTVLANFEASGISPKYGPMTSISEMYLLPSWDDTLISLIEDKVSFVDIGIISINHLTYAQMRVLFPMMTTEQLDTFFRYRDGSLAMGVEEQGYDEGPHPFQSVSSFQSYIVNELQIVSEAEFEERMNELSKYGLRLGLASKFFLVSSQGSFERSTFNIEAYVDLPIEEESKKTEGARQNDQNTNQGQSQNQGQTNTRSQNGENNSNSSREETAFKLLAPRIVQIRMN